MRRIVLVATAVGLLSAGCGNVGPASSSPAPSHPSASPSSSGIAACTSVSLVASAASPVTAGTKLTVIASAYGCAPATWRFRLVRVSTGASLVTQTWGVSNTWTWDTTTWSADTYRLEADARPYGSSETEPDASGRLEIVLVTATPPATVTRCTSVALTASVESPVPAGTKVTFAALAVGCPAAEYRFWRLDPNGVGVVTRMWANTGTWTWDTTGATADRYVIQVDAKAYGVPNDDADTTAMVEIDVVHAAPKP